MDNIIGLIGYMGLTGAFIISIFTVLFAALVHFKRFSSLHGLPTVLVHTQTVLLSVAVLSLAIILQTGAYQYEQVFNAVESLMTPVERIGGLWSGQAASLLFWSFIMSAAISLGVRIGKRQVAPNQIATVILILELSLVFFLAPDIFVSSPFAKIFRLSNGELVTAFFSPTGADLLVPIDGQGMNPALRHIAMLLHPPTLYLGLIGLFLPYAFALSALLHQDHTHAWINRIFPVALIAYVFLTLGMLLGSWWAYTILGWGGYWGWDAVEISGLLPWLLLFGLLHAMRLSMHRKDAIRWVYVFSFTIVILTLFGILITRSGILESVHTYASGTMGPILTSLIMIHMSAVLFGVFRNGKSVLAHKNSDKTLGTHINRWFFRCIVVLVLIYLFGQSLPLTSQLLLGVKYSFKATDYEIYSAPLLFLLAILTALCPLADYYEAERDIFWRVLIKFLIFSMFFPIAAFFYVPFSIPIIVGFWASGFLLMSWAYAAFRDILMPIIKGKPGSVWSKRLGMVIIHLGFAMMAIGIIGVETMSNNQSLTLTPNKPVRFDQYAVTYSAQSSTYIEEGNPSYAATIIIDYHDGASKYFTPAITHYIKTGVFYPVPAIQAGFFQDIQVVVENFPSSPAADINIHIACFPLMSWIWAGGAMMAAGGVLPVFFRRMK